MRNGKKKMDNLDREIREIIFEDEWRRGNVIHRAKRIRKMRCNKKINKLKSWFKK
jgi:hypothetical protein